MARFYEFCLDTANPHSDVATFWAAVSGGKAQASSGGGPPDVAGRTDNQSIAICPVPEHKTVKNRVHLDVYARSIDDLVGLGATVQVPAEESGFHWTVMLDPEGNEFCAFLREELPDYRIHGLVIDSADPQSQAQWWGEVLGVEVEDNTQHGGGWWTLLHATDDPVLTWDFVPVPEPKTVKNRLHWDVRGTVEEFLDRGATHLWDRPRWVVLADPEGNEFCVFPPKA
jgi:catechol 2,3-dioxygenase-like lactoylglutathione lyase family enzyme